MPTPKTNRYSVFPWPCPSRVHTTGDRNMEVLAGKQSSGARKAWAFCNSCQIFPSSKGNPKHLAAMKGDSDGAPSPSPVPALEPEAPPPVRGFSLFGRTQRSPQTRPSLGPPFLGRGRPLCGGVRGPLNRRRHLTPSLSPMGECLVKPLALPPLPHRLHQRRCVSHRRGALRADADIGRRLAADRRLTVRR